MWKQYLFGGVVSIAAIWLYAKMVDLEQMAQALKDMDPIWLVPCCLIYLASYAVRALRWHYLMRPVARVGFMPLFKSLMLGFLGNNLLPAHLGEVVRAMFLGQTEGVNKSATFATIVLERVYDGLTVLLFLLFVLLFYDVPETGAQGGIINLSFLRTAGWVGLAFFGGLLIILQLFRFQSERACKLVGYCLKPAPQNLAQKILGMLDSFGEGLSLAKGRDLLWTGVLFRTGLADSFRLGLVPVPRLWHQTGLHGRSASAGGDRPGHPGSHRPGLYRRISPGRRGHPRLFGGGPGQGRFFRHGALAGARGGDQHNRLLFRLAPWFRPAVYWQKGPGIRRPGA